MALTTALCFLFLWPSGADLALDLYKSAQTSGHLSAVPAEVEKISEARLGTCRLSPFGLGLCEEGAEDEAHRATGA